MIFSAVFCDSIYQNRLGNSVESYRLRSQRISKFNMLPSIEDQVRDFLMEKSYLLPPRKENNSRRRRNLKMRFLKKF